MGKYTGKPGTNPNDSGESSIETIVNGINNKLYKEYGKNYISMSGGRYYVSEPAKEFVVSELLNDDSITPEQMYEYMNKLGIESGYLDTMMKDGHYRR